MRKWEEPELMTLGVENTKAVGIDDDECGICDCDFDEGIEDDCKKGGDCICHEFRPTLPSPS